MKGISIIILAVCPIAFGILYGNKLKNDARIISSILNLLRHIKFQIEVFLRPQKDIFLSFEDAVLQKCGILPKIKEYIRFDNINGFAKAIYEEKDALYLNNDEKKALYDFAASFGGFSKEMQISECEKIIKCIENAEKRILSDIDAKAKLSNTIGFCIGLGIIILLI